MRKITEYRRQYLRKYQREWLKKRKSEWFQKNGPCKGCGSWNSLELDHIDRKIKVHHKVWSWKDSRRLKELSKCQVLCKKCHEKKTFKEMGWKEHQASRYRRGCRCRICTDAAVALVTKNRNKNGRYDQNPSAPAKF